MSSRLHLIFVIFRKEVLDLLRDRRTIFMMVVVPILLYPLLLIVVMQIAVFQAGRLEEQASRIVVLNGQAAPSILDSIRASSVLEVIDSTGWSEGVKTGDVDAAIEFSDRFEESVSADLQPEIIIYFNSSREFSRRTKSRLEEPLDGYRAHVVEERIRALNADAELLIPFKQADENLASDEQQQGMVVGSMLGYLLIFMVLTGAFYAAIDLTAGEKERGTLETLLVSPVGRLEIVYGKFLATVTASVLTAILNLTSMGLTAVYGLQLLGKGAEGFAAIAISPLSLLLVFLIVIPLAVLFSGVCLAVAVTARNYKEGQSALTPVMILVSLPAMVVLLPGVEISPALALVPVTNVVLLTVEFMRGNYLLWESLITIFTTSILAGLSLWWVISQFRQESVLFRHADEIRWSIFKRRPAASATPVPSAGTALLSGLVLLIVLNLLGSFALDWGVVRSIVIAQAAVLIPIALTIYRGNHNVRRTLALRLPRPQAWIATVIFALRGWLITVEVSSIQHLFLPFPEELLEEFKDLFAVLENMPILLGLFLIALLPGVCEELFCRGFMLRAFQTRLGTNGAIILVAIIFGMLHLNPYRLLPTMLLGLLFGFISVWSGSIYPAMLGHFLNNATTFLVQKNVAWFEGIEWLSSETDLLPTWIVALAVMILGVSLHWLWRLRSFPDSESISVPEEPR